VLSVEDWAKIRRLHHNEGMPIKVIARAMRCSKNTVKAALRSEGPPKYQRPSRGSVADEVEPRIRELLQAWPTIPATVIAERIGWQYSIRILRDREGELRPVYLPADPASRTSYEPGEIGQCDLWFPEVDIPVGFGQRRSAVRLPVLTMVSGYSRWLSARLLPSEAEDLFAGWWSLLAELGGVPRTLVWDGESAIGRWRRGTSELTVDCQAFRGTSPPRSSSANPVIPRPRAWSNGATATWRPPSWPGAPSPTPRTSTPSSPAGCPGRTPGRCGCWAARRLTGSRRTGPRCLRCHRWRR